MQTFVTTKALIINDGGEVLLLKRSQTDERRPEQWDFPGGWVNTGEDAWTTVKRETFEEAGIVIDDIRLVYALTEVAEKGGSGTWLAFIARVSGKPKIKVGDEHDDYLWMKLEKAVSAITYERQRKMVEYVLEHNLHLDS